jgi:uncharacterized protein (UPF0548 family)
MATLASAGRGHHEAGEERFVVELTRDQEVRIAVRAFSRPASILARLGGPFTRSIQDYTTKRYLDALQHIAEPRRG